MIIEVIPTNPKSYSVSKDLGCVVNSVSRSPYHCVARSLCYPASRRCRHKKKEEKREI